MTEEEKKFTELDKALIQMAGQIGTLTAGSVKMESAIEQLSEAMTVVARDKMTVEHHEEKIDVLFSKTDKLEKWQKDTTESMHTSCSLKTEEISTSLWKALTVSGLMFLLFVGAVLYFNGKVTTLELETTRLSGKIEMIENYQNRNYGFLQGIKKDEE